MNVGGFPPRPEDTSPRYDYNGRMCIIASEARRVRTARHSRYKFARSIHLVHLSLFHHYMLRQLCRRNLGLKKCYHSSAIRQAPPPRYVRFSYPNPNSGNSNKGNFFQDRTWPIKVGIGIAGLGTIYYVSW